MQKPHEPHMPAFMLARIDLEAMIAAGELPEDAAWMVLAHCWGCLEPLADNEMRAGLCPRCQVRKVWQLN